MNAITTIPADLCGSTHRIVSSLVLTLLASVAVLAPARSGAQSTWVGGTSADWSVDSNWDPSGVPSGVDTVVNTSAGNIATVTSDVSADQPNRLRIGDGAIGTINVQSGANLIVNGETWLGNTTLGQGTMNISGGTMTVNSWFAVGRGGGQGTVNMTGGTLAVSGNPLGVGLDGGTVGVFNQNGGVVTLASDLWVGNNDQGGNQNNATYNLISGSITVNSWTVIGRHNTVGVLNISGGSLTKTSDNGNQMLIGVDQDSSTGIINQTGGAITNTASDTYLAGYNAGTGVWNLNGGYAILSLLQLCHNNNGESSGTMNLNTNGTLMVGSIGSGGTAPTSIFNFNGGALVASGDNANFLQGLTTVNVRNGGAIINDGGFSVAISQNLSHSAIGGDNAIDGGLTKNGSGTLALSGVNTYTGGTIVNQGTLELDVTGSNPSALRLASGTTLNLNYTGTYAIAGFYTNGIALPNGTYNSGNLSGFITGTGDLQVGIISLGIWDGGGVNNNWSTGANWDQNVLPIFPIGLTFAGSTRLTNTNDFSGITVSGITFDSAAGAFVLNGNDLTLSGNIGFNANPAAPVTQTVNLNMTWGADKTIDTPANGNLTLGGNLTSVNALSKIDAGTLTLGGTDSFAQFNLNGGTNTITGNTTINGTGGIVYVGNGDSLPLCSGTLVIQPGATLSLVGTFNDDVVIGRDSGSGTVIQNGGIFTFNNNQQNMWVGATIQAGTRAEYDMNGGLLDMSDKVLGVGLGNGVLSTGAVNQVSGVITNVNKLWLGGLLGIGSGNYTMSGGSIYIGSGGITTVSGNYAINLGGGTVGAYASWASPLNMNLTNLNGSVTFAPAANTITLSGVLSGNGGLTVAGGGTLALSGANTYTGDTIVNAGSTLQVVPGVYNFSSSFRLTNGAILNVNGSGTYIVAHFYTNGVALPNGVYSAGNLGAFISGPGSLQVGDVAFSLQPQNQLAYLNINQSVTLMSQTVGASATYQWYLNGQTVAGATSTNLTLSNLQMGSAGNLYVVATSGSGSVTSSVIALTIYGENNNVFAYERFDYTGSTDGSTPIDDGSHNGGLGWAAAWTFVDGAQGNSVVVPASLVGGTKAPNGYDSRSIGNSLWNYGGSRVGRYFDTSSSSELFKQGFVDANGNIGANGKTIYLSFMQEPNSTASYYELGLKRGNLSDPGRIGGITSDPNTGEVYWRTESPAGGGSTWGDLGLGDANTVDFYVVRIDFKAGNDDVYVYRNPTSSTEPAVPTYTLLNAADMSLSGISVDAFVGPQMGVDEIRLGATWADAIGLAVSNLLPPSKTVNGYKVQFACTPGNSYRIQRATNVTGPWTDIQTVVGPENAFIEYEDISAPSGQSFYRTVTP
jgi:autotransporter-associated beta strand protein